FACSVLDQTGVSQKNGAVMSHVRLNRDAEDAAGTRIGTGGADLVLGFDMVVAASRDAIATMHGETTRAVINDHLVPLAAFAENPDMELNAGGYVDVIGARLGADAVDFFNATRAATKLLGDAIAASILLLGYAWQNGLLPLSMGSISAAITLNGVAVEDNLRAFAWGRVAAADPGRVAAIMDGGKTAKPTDGSDLDRFIADNCAELRAYQNNAYGSRYEKRLQNLQERVTGSAPGREDILWAAARNLYRLMAYKDEYEVARLFTHARFRARLQARFDGALRLNYHLAPPLFAPKNSVSGAPRKVRFGAWMGPVFGFLAQLKFLRGTPFDPFGALAERRAERNLRDQFEDLIDGIARNLTAANSNAALALITNFDQVRGFGHIKQDSMEAAERDTDRLRADFANGARAAAE
ncbi:MAG: DUF6537 domain-containing protein, partial [Pseudomonadota bacterium]|nr:DUF6537 domain-containing protein [Pseudomonadota bacterium]